MPDRQILATSGGLMYRRSRTPRFGGLLRHALALSKASRPRLCFLATASGDSASTLADLYGAAAGENVAASHLALFPMPNVEDVRGHLLAQDVVWVGGGSVANLLALWRVHGLDEVMREAWEQGTVLAGVSAGSLCWHAGGTTDSFGPQLRSVTNGLGFLPYGNGVHYDSEEQRRPLLQRLVADHVLPCSFATDDGVGLHYLGTDLHEAVAEVPGRFAWRVEADGNGGAAETKIPTRLLGY